MSDLKQNLIFTIACLLLVSPSSAMPTIGGLAIGADVSYSVWQNPHSSYGKRLNLLMTPPNRLNSRFSKFDLGFAFYLGLGHISNNPDFFLADVGATLTYSPLSNWVIRPNLAVRATLSLAPIPIITSHADGGLGLSLHLSESAEVTLTAWQSVLTLFSSRATLFSLTEIGIGFRYRFGE